MKNKKWKHQAGSAGGGAVYGIGMIGAAIYFLQHSNTLWEGIMAIVKAIVWPGILIYRVLELLKL